MYYKPDITKDWDGERAHIVDFDEEKLEEVREFFDGLVERLKAIDPKISCNTGYCPILGLQNRSISLKSGLLRDSIEGGYPPGPTPSRKFPFASITVYAHSEKGYLVEQSFYFGEGVLDMKMFFVLETKSKFDPNDRDGKIYGGGEVCFSELAPNLSKTNFEGLVEKYYEKVIGCCFKTKETNHPWTFMANKEAWGNI